MESKSTLRQGDILLLLIHRSGMSRTEVAKKLDIHPNHLSRLYKSEILTNKIKTRASKLFDVPISAFDDAELAKSGEELQILDESSPMLNLNNLENLSAPEIFRYLEEKDRRHHEERARLLGIIENLTKSK